MTTEEETLNEMLTYIATPEQQAQIHAYAAKLRTAFVNDPLLAVATALVAQEIIVHDGKEDSA